MRVWLLSSGSSGNLAIVESDGARLMVDAGIGPSAAAAKMRELGADLFPKGVLGVVLTHHHGDHMGHAMPLARALRVPLYAHRGVAADRVRRRFEVRPYEPGAVLTIGPFQLRAQWVPHDAPQVALSIQAGGRRVGIATDLGHVSSGLPSFLGECGGCLVEANYCRAMLADGPYPPRLKERVGGDYGHLDNVQTAELASALVGTRVGKLWLCHLSRVNNSPSRALEVVQPRARGIDVEAIPHGVSRVLDVPPAAQPASHRMTQLVLRFDGGAARV